MNNYTLSTFLLIMGLLITLVAQIYITYSYSKYKKIKNSKGISGFDAARKILDENGLKDVYVTEIKGNLMDHYDSSRKVIRLSTDIFHGDTIASVSVASHEAGHALQDKEKYNFMKFRSLMFPIVNFSSKAGYFSILIGLIFGYTNLIWVGIVLELIILIFQIITLPVEFNASYRAESEILKHKLLSKNEITSSKLMLRAAAFTYIASVLTSILQILRLIIITGSRDD